MFCPKCGKSDQQELTFCRQCGDFLPDLSESGRRRIKTPKERFRVSLVFNLLSAVAGISMAIALLVVFRGDDSTHPVIYSAISLFFVISIWQIVSFVNNWKLRKRFIREEDESEIAETELTQRAFDPVNSVESLPEADFSGFAPASVTEKTTKNLKVAV